MCSTIGFSPTSPMPHSAAHGGARSSSRAIRKNPRHASASITAASAEIDSNTSRPLSVATAASA